MVTTGLSKRQVSESAKPQQLQTAAETGLDATPQKKNLFDLPPEILLLILELIYAEPIVGGPSNSGIIASLKNTRAGRLLRFALASETCFALASPLIYRVVNLRICISERKDLVSFFQDSLDTGKLSHIRQLCLPACFEREDLGAVVESCTRLKTLILYFDEGHKLAPALRLLSTKAPKNLSCLCLDLMDADNVRSFYKLPATMPPSVREISVIADRHVDSKTIFETLERSPAVEKIQLGGITFSQEPGLEFENYPISLAKVKAVSVYYALSLSDAVRRFPNLASLDIYDGTDFSAKSWTALAGLSALRNLYITRCRASVLSQIQIFRGRLDCLVLDSFHCDHVDEETLAAASTILPSKADLIVVMEQTDQLGDNTQRQHEVWMIVPNLIWTGYDGSSPYLSWDEDDGLWPTLIRRPR